MELRAIVGVETNLEALKNRGSPHLTFEGSDLGAIAGDALSLHISPFILCELPRYFVRALTKNAKSTPTVPK